MGASGRGSWRSLSTAAARCLRAGIYDGAKSVRTHQYCALGNRCENWDGCETMLTKPHHVGQWRKLAGNAYFNACRDAQDLKATTLPGTADINQKASCLSGYLDRSFSPWNRCNKFSSQETLAFSRSSVCLRHYSAEPGAQSEMETSSQKQGLHESKIREELLSEAKAPTSEGVQSVTAQDGPVGPQGIGIEEDLTAEEAAILREAEIEYEKALKEGEGRAVSIDSLKQMLQELETSGDPNDARIAIIALRLGQEYESGGERPELFLSHGERARKIFESCAPRFSAETAMCHHLIASAFHRMGQHDKSLESLNQALELLKDKEGQDYDPVKFAVHFLLGDTLAAFGKHEEALHHYCVGLSVQETVLEAGHPQLATNYRQVGEAFTQVMFYDEAKALVEKALEIHQKLHGAGSMDEAIDRRLLAVIYSGLEEHEKALEEQQIVKKILKEKNFGEEAVFVEIAVADTQITLKRYDDAIASLQSAMSQMDEGSSMRALATVNLAKALAQQGKMEDALSQCSTAVKFFEQKMEDLNAQSPDALAVGEGFTELAAIYERAGQFEEAIRLLKRAVEVFKKIPQQLNAAAGAQAQIGMLLFFTGKVQEAIPYMEESANSLRQTFGDAHFSLALVLNHLGVAHVELENLSTAAELFEEAKGILSKTHGPGQHDTLAVYYNLVRVYTRLERYAEAITCSKHIVGELEKQGEDSKDALTEAQKQLEKLEQQHGEGTIASTP